MKRQEKEKETGKGKGKGGKEEVIVKLEMDDTGESAIEENNGLGNDLDAEDVKDVERGVRRRGKKKT